MLSEVREREILHDLTYMWNLRKRKKNLAISTKNRLVAGQGIQISSHKRKSWECKVEYDDYG